MAQTKKSAEEEVVPDVHAEAAAERMRAPTLYDDPVVATPGVLEDIEGDAGPTALVDADTDVGLDSSVDNRDQVQPMLDSLYKDAVEQQEGIEPEAQAAKLEESRKASREAAEAPAKK